MIEKIHQKLSDSKVARMECTRFGGIHDALRILPYGCNGSA